MAQIEKATLNAIDDYYDEIIKNLQRIQREIQEKVNKEFRDSFDNDKDVKEVFRLFGIIRKKYNEIKLDLDCKIYSFAEIYEYKKDKKWIEAEIEIKKLRNQRALLITQLECNPKNSSEYKKAYEEMQKLFI